MKNHLSCNYRIISSVPILYIEKMSKWYGTYFYANVKYFVPTYSDAITTLHFIKIGKGNVINGNFLRKLDSYHHTSIFLRYTILRRGFIPFAQSFLCTLNSWSNIKKIYITF